MLISELFETGERMSCLSLLCSILCVVLTPSFVFFICFPHSPFRYVRGRLTLSRVNEGLEEVNEIVSSKYSIINNHGLKQSTEDRKLYLVSIHLCVSLLFIHFPSLPLSLLPLFPCS